MNSDLKQNEAMLYGYIYKITFPDKDFYIGQKKYGAQKDKIGINYFGSGIKLKDKYALFDISDVTFEIIDRAKSEDALHELEIHYIKELSPTLNISSGGDGGTTYGFRGKRHTDEAKRIIGLKGKGRVPPNKGKKMSEDTRNKVRLARSKQVITQEHRDNISRGLTRAYREGRKVFVPAADPGAKNKKISEAWTPEMRESMSNRMKGSIPWNKES